MAGGAAVSLEAQLEPERWRRWLATSWPQFLARRQGWLRRGGAEAEGITRDLLRLVLLWPSEEIAAAPGPGLMLGGSERGYVALARPGTIAARRPEACPLVRRAASYAQAQRVARSGACDGGIFYLEDCGGEARRERVRAWLGQTVPPGELWWATPVGLPLRWSQPQGDLFWRAPPENPQMAQAAPEPTTRLHPKYGLPARCFAYAGDGRDPRTWKLPFRSADYRPDPRRLAAAVARVIAAGPPRGLGVPELALGLVVRRLAQAARELGQLPPQCAQPHWAMAQLAKLERSLAEPDFQLALPPRRFEPGAADGRIGQLRRWL